MRHCKPKTREDEIFSLVESSVLEKEWCETEEVAFFGYPDDGLGDGYISDDVYYWH